MPAFYKVLKQESVLFELYNEEWCTTKGFWLTNLIEELRNL